MSGPPQYLSTDDVQRHFAGGPELRKGAVMAMIGEHIYKREGDRWRLLDDRTYRSIEELMEATSEPT